MGENGSDAPLEVGIFPDRRAAHVWASRQNETQRQQNWGRGSAGPMTFTPKPLYKEPDPAELVLPERQWEDGDARDL